MAPRVERDDEPGEAEEYYAMKRAGTADPHARYDAARQRMSSMARYSSVSDRVLPSQRMRQASDDVERWTFLGPGNIGGRSRTLLIDRDDPNVMYAGGVSGGVWKTLNGGERWEPIGDVLTNLAVNSLVMDPKDRNVIYAGTGEGYFREVVRGTALPLRGDGIYVTRDGGATWQQLASTRNEDFHWVNDLEISRHDSQRLYAATRTGVWRSTDGGATWTRTLTTTVTGGCLDLAVRPDTEGDVVFASCGTFERATVYRAKRADADAQWEPVLSDENMGRTSLAIAPSRPSTIYALAASNEPDNMRNQGLLAVFRSDENGDPGSWRATARNTDERKLNRLLLTNPAPATASDCLGGSDNFVTMGWYCNVIAVDPTDAERVWSAGVDLFRSDDGGVTWGVASYWWTDEHAPAFAHADHHRIVFHPAYDGETNATMYSMNDGGIYRTENARAPVALDNRATCESGKSSVQFTSLNRNLGITQFYNGAVFPDGRRFIGGAQDNGTLVGTLESGTDAWRRVHGGDGGYVAVNPDNSSVIFVESQGGNIVRSINGGQTFSPARSGITGDQFLFIAPFVMDPNRPTTLWIGGRRLWKTTNNAAQWSAASPALAAQISALAVARGNSDAVLAGTTTGRIYRNAGGTWVDVLPQPGFVSWLAFDPNNTSTAYATYAGFGGRHVWKSTDGGATWAPIDNGLPDMPVHSIAVDPLGGRLFLGTDLGVFVSTDDGATWLVENTGFAPAVTETVLIGPGERGPAVYAFTHGRGAWRAELGLDKRKRGVRR
jgi:photosystem II stability/assembly factor-like uncharacterized protein